MAPHCGALGLLLLALLRTTLAEEDMSLTTTLPPALLSGDNSTLDAAECARQQSSCEADLALQAGRVGPNPGPGGRPGRPVCGSDNATYVNDCALKRAQCEGRNVAVAHRGKCKDHTPCFSYQRRASRSAGRGGGGGAYMPTCQEDGSYAPVQCHKETGYCWCVNPQGKPVPNSSVQGGRPNCARAGKTRRGSSPRRRRLQKKGCGRADRTNFNNNLIKIFRLEYKRSSPPSDGGIELDLDGRVLDWKFSALDSDSDGSLKRVEFRDLRRLVRKVLKPKPCARTFARRCDMDRNLLISREEWAACLGYDFSRERQPQSPAAHSVLQESVSTLTGHLPGFPDDSLSRKDEPEVTDCLSDRQAVLDEQRAGSTDLYVPECLPDGRYHKLQCYKSTGYCWCVHEDSGKPIPGTSVKDKRPKCDELVPANRPMKGCPEPRKQAFLRDLMEFFKLRMQAAMNETEGESSLDWQISPEDRIASWNFLALDQNKNKVLERSEWKTFRALVTTQRLLRRCGKKLPRYCDVNHDRTISITEWLECLRTPTPVVAVTTTSNPRRRGPNPIESYLKAD